MIYFYLFLTSFFLSLIFTFLAKKVGFRYGFFDNPEGDELKIHKKPIPFTGGVAIFGVFVLSFFIAFLLKLRGIVLFNFDSKILVILLGAFASFIYGFWDDLKWHRTITVISQKLKLFVQISLGIFVVALMIYSGIFWNFIPVYYLSFAVSVIYFLVIFNAINIQDGLDGLLGGISWISLLGFLIISFGIADSFISFISLVLLGAIMGFLFYNWNPASIFMGNNGSQFLGFIMTFLAIYYTMKPYNLYWLLGPLFIVGMPLLNFIFVVLRRIIKKQSIFKADRHHLYDEILSRVGSIKKTVLINYLIQIILVIIGVYLIG